MKDIFPLFFFLMVSSGGFAQYDTTIIKPRKENGMLQAVADLDAAPQLYKGQEYRISITASSEHDIKITTKNAHIELAERGDRGTGGMKYIFTPLDTGKCIINIGLIIDEKRQTTLLSKFYYVIDYPVPPIHLNNFTSGSVIEELSDSIEIKCNYSPNTGVFDKYPILNWKVQIDDGTIEGTGNYLTKDVIDLIMQSAPKSILQIELNLEDNKTGHKTSRGVFIIDLINQEERK